MGTAIGDRIMAFITGAVGGDAADLLVRRDLVQKVGQDRRITDVAPGDLDGPDFQWLFVDPEVDLAPDAPFWTAMFAGVPFAFALRLDPCAVDQQMERALGATVKDVHRQGLLTAGSCAEVRHGPVKTDQAQQARRSRLAMVARTSGATWLDLPECHPERHLHRQTCLDSGIATGLLSATPAGRRGIPTHPGGRTRSSGSHGT